jgi:hypothetical protein
MSHLERYKEIQVFQDGTWVEQNHVDHDGPILRGVITHTHIEGSNSVWYETYELVDNTYLVLATYKHESPNDFDRANPPLDETQSPWVLIEQ